MHLIIDADPIVYRCGFAAERTDYHLVVESPGGELRELHFTPKPKLGAGTQALNWEKAHPTWHVLEKIKDVHPDSKEEALNAVDTQLNSIEKEVRDHHRLSVFDKITIILSGPRNYREDIATIFPYKGNRDPDHKPHWYQSIRDHLTSQWAATVVHGREADDECSIIAATSRASLRVQSVEPGDNTASSVHRSRQSALSYVIATIDKDLDQIPGWHYNYLKCVHYNQTVADARLFFWQQCLSGDPTDGIPGCWKIGEGKAQKFTSTYGRVSDGNLWQAIVGEYARSTKIAGCPYVGSDPAAVALETARLVYLQQAEGELWNPPGIPHGLLPGYEDDTV